ncbi:MAG: DUF2130 domain-containing protein [Spirosomataceae bacterium]
MNNYHIHCPKCNHEINIETVLAERIEAEQAAKFAIRQKELDQQELQIAQAKENQQALLAQLLSQEKTKLMQQLKTQIGAEKEEEVALLKNELNQKSKIVAELRQQEGNLLRQKRQLDEEKAGINAEIEKRIAQELVGIEQKFKEKSQEEAMLKLKEKDMLIEQLNDRVKDMQRKMEQGSIQLQGEAQELVIEEMLRRTHPFDIIEEIKKGENGADLLQVVQNKLGQPCGGILYESKNTKHFSEGWVQKLKDDMLLKKVDLGVIVTQALPKGISTFEQREDNVWICSFEHLKALTFVLRASLLKVDEVRIVQANQGEKSQMLYHYLMSPEFKNQLSVIHDTFAQMHTSLAKEKKAAIANFKKREKEIDRVLVNLSGIAGSINGISGQTVAEFAEFEVLEDEMALLES